jgi:site-specific DNA-methyltransferase (adenine-specific)
VPRRKIYASNAQKQAAYRARKRQPATFSRKSTEWGTPLGLFRKLDAEFGFTLDVCAVPENAKCRRYFTPAENGLLRKWEGVCWMNPPYGADVGKWVRKAHLSARDGATVICLLPARTDTAWWHEYVIPYAEVRFVRGRIRFTGARSSAPFPSAIVLFGYPAGAFS